jgi:hypothetical protein
MLHRIAATAKGSVNHETHDCHSALAFLPLRASAFVETRDFPPEVVLYATRELMNALVQVDDRICAASEDTLGSRSKSPFKQRSPEDFEGFYRRAKDWELKRETLKVVYGLMQQREAAQEAAQYTFTPVLMNTSAVSCFLTKAEELRKAGKAEGKRIQQQIKERSGNPFKDSDFQLAKPLPGRRKKFEITSRVSLFLDSTRAENSGTGTVLENSGKTIRAVKKSPDMLSKVLGNYVKIHPEKPKKTLGNSLIKKSPEMLNEILGNFVKKHHETPKKSLGNSAVKSPEMLNEILGNFIKNSSGAEAV